MYFFLLFPLEKSNLLPKRRRTPTYKKSLRQKKNLICCFVLAFLISYPSIKFYIESLKVQKNKLPTKKHFFLFLIQNFFFPSFPPLNLSPSFLFSKPIQNDMTTNFTFQISEFYQKNLREKEPLSLSRLEQRSFKL